MKAKLIILLLTWIVITMTAGACWAEQTMRIRVENQTNEVLQIYIDGAFTGQVNPKELTEPFETPRYSVYTLRAKNTNGIIVYEKKWKLAEMKEYDFTPVIHGSDLTHDF